MNNATSDPNQTDTLNLRSIYEQVVARRWLLVTSVVIFTVVSAAFALLSAPVYRATTLLVPAGTERNNLSGQLNSALGALGGLAAMAGVGLGGNDASTEEALAVLRSRQFTEGFILDNQLMPKLFADKWDEASRQWKVGKQGQPTPARTYRYFDRKIRAVNLDKKTGLVMLKIEWTDREEAAAWANDLVRRLNAEMRARAIANANASVGFLEKELESTSVIETRQAINRLIEAQIKQRMLANVSEEYAFRVVDRAMAPDADDPVRPRKVLIIAAGPVLGLVVGVICIVLVSAVRPARRASQIAA